MRKFFCLLTCCFSLAIFAKGEDPKAIISQPQKQTDECCERTVHVRVLVEEFGIFFLGSGTARGCVESGTTDNPRNLDVACDLASRAAGEIATKAVEKAIAEYRP